MRTAHTAAAPKRTGPAIILTGEVEHLLEGDDVENGQEQHAGSRRHAHQETHQPPGGTAESKNKKKLQLEIKNTRAFYGS